MHVPDPVDVDGGAEVEVGLDGGGDLGEERHPVLLVSANNFFFYFSILSWKGKEEENDHLDEKSTPFPQSHNLKRSPSQSKSLSWEAAV